MEKKKLITGIVAGVIGLALVGTIAYLYVNLDSQRKENKAMQELADLDKKEMENEYQQFANQYSEMKTQITNDSIVAQLTAEQEKTEALRSRLAEGRFSKPGARDLLAPVIRLEPLTAEEMLVLCEKLADMHAGLYGYERKITTDDLAGFIRIEYGRIGADQNITPREVIRDFIELLDLQAHFRRACRLDKEFP